MHLYKEELSAKNIIDCLPTACLLLSGKAAPVECNEALMEMFEATSLYDVLPQFDNAAIKQAIRNSEKGLDLVCKKPCGTGIHLSLKLKQISVGIGSYYVASVSETNLLEEQNSLMLNSAPISISVFDGSYKNIACNQEAARMYGFKTTSDYSMFYNNTMPPLQPDGRSSRMVLRECIDEAYIKGTSKRKIMRLKFDGTLIPVEAYFARAESRGKIVVVGYARSLEDVQEVLEREKEALEAVNLFMETAPFGIEIWNENMEIVDCNYQLAEMFGLASIKAFIEHVKQSRSNHIQQAYFNQALQFGFARYEWEFSRPDGRKIPCEVKLVRVVRGRRVQIFVYLHDLSEMKLAMHQASEADVRAKMMLDSTPMACFLIREDVTAIDCNKAAVDLFGFANKAQAIARFLDIFPVSEGYAQKPGPPASLAWVGEDEFESFEYTHKTVDTGELIPCEVILYRLSYQGQPIIASYMRDLREIKAMIAEMKRIDIAEEESKAKSQFLARMSHEIRTPMNAIVGITDIQLRKGGHRPHTEEAFMQIRSSSNILLSIINDILDLSKVEAGKMEIFPAPYDLASMIFDTAQLVVSQYVGSKEIDFKLRIDDNLPSVLIGDELRIKQILNNVLSNAFKYTSRGSVTASFTYENGFLHASVVDTGQGMNEFQLSSLFRSEYVRFNELSNRVIEGTGLGMNITNNLVQIMNGEIKATSTPGKGSTFTVSLPQGSESDEVIGYDAARSLELMIPPERVFVPVSEMEYEELAYGKVLVVDDVESNLYVANGLLSPYGLSIEIARSGYEAIDLVKDGKEYDIIFMDHMMPGMDGIEAVKIIREMGYQKPIVALTANTIMGQAELFASNGFSSFISKPINTGALNNCLMRFIKDMHPEAHIEKKGQSTMKHSEYNDVSKLVVESFLRDAQRATSEIGRLCDKPGWDDVDFTNFTVIVHGLKSALGNVQEKELSKVAGRLELVGREKDFETIKVSAPQFLDDLRAVVQKLEPSTSAQEEDLAENMEVLREKLAEAQEACDGYNKKAAKIALAALSNYKWSSETEKFISELGVHLLHSDFEEASDAIEMYLSR